MTAFIYYLKYTGFIYSTREVQRNEKEYDPDTVGKFSHYSYVEKVQFRDCTYDIYAPQFTFIDDGAEAFYLANKEAIDRCANYFIHFKQDVHILQDINSINAVCFVSFCTLAKTIKRVGSLIISDEVKVKED